MPTRRYQKNDRGVVLTAHKDLDLRAVLGSWTSRAEAVELACQSGQHKQVIGALVDELELAGYVRREPDPADRRAKLIVPTEQGSAQMAGIDAAMADIDATISGDLGERRYHEFKHTFRRVAQILANET